MFGFFDFLKIHHDKYYIEANAMNKPVLEPFDVCMKVADTMLYNSLDGHVEVNPDYFETCKEISKELYERILRGHGVPNPFYKQQ